MLLTTLTIGFLLVYGVLIFFYFYQWNQLQDFQPAVEPPIVSVSVIIAARNEEDTLPLLLKDLRRQTYPYHLFEVIIIDDYSTDDTAAIAKDFDGTHEKLILPDLPPEKSSKKAAIASGIKKAKGELIVITDADCRVGEEWLQSIASFYQARDAAFIAAPVMFTHNGSLLEIFQALDFITLQGITAASVAANKHTMCNGANLAYTKKAFTSVNGFEGIDRVATGDDMLLMHKIWKKHPARVFYLKSKAAIVKTAALKSWASFLNQRKRWASKTLVYDDARIMMVLGFKDRGLHPLLFILLLQLFWVTLTVVLSTYFVLSAKYLLAKTWYLLAFVATPLFLWKEERVFKRSVLILFTSMLMVTAVSLVRHAATGFTFSTINAALAPFFRNHVNYSALLVCMLPLQILCWQQAKTWQWKQAVLLSFLITLPALYFAFARGAWLALLTGAFAYWLLNRKWLFQSFIAMVLLVTALVFWLRHDNRYLSFAHDYTSTIFHPNLDEHLAATYQLKDMSTAERFHRWIAGVRMLEDRWQTGFGPTTFYRHYKSYTVPAFKTWVSKNEEQSTVHNYFLLLAVEQGIAGLLLFLTLLGLQFYYVQNIYHRTTDLFRKRTVMAIGIILVMLCTLNFLSDLIETDKVGSLFYLCLAALVVADRKTRLEERASLPA